jgi:hypothetical protein
MPVDFYFKPKCCLPKPLKKNVYNPDVFSRLPLNIRIAHQIVTSVGTANQCYTRINVPLNAYGRWAGAPGGSGPGVSSTMNYVPYTDTSGLGPKIGGAICNCADIAPFPTFSPINSVAPVISGNTTRGSTLTTTNGTWFGNPSPTFTYQWFRGNTPIPNQTNITYVLVLADGGQPITCRVTGTNNVGSGVGISNVITPILGPPQSVTFSGVGSFETIYVNSLNQVVTSPLTNGFTIYRVTATSQGATYLINSNSASTPISFLVIGGGGSGSAFDTGGGILPGGGGAGGFIESSGTTNTATPYSIYVGRGGFLLNNTASGENSLLQLSSGTLNAIGGGGGANLSTGLNGLNGGSGGGGAFNFNNNNFGTGGNGTPGQGFEGGIGSSSGSGGGAGGSPATNSLNGGVGLPSTITGQSIYYAGGGGSIGRVGGIGGGGNGGIGGPGGQGTPGTNGLGGGGGSGRNGASGGDGVVILRIPSFI